MFAETHSWQTPPLVVPAEVGEMGEVVSLTHPAAARLPLATPSLSIPVDRVSILPSERRSFARQSSTEKP